MKNTINYFYKLIPNDIHHHNENYYFQINNEYYLFMPFYYNIDHIKTIYDYLRNNHIYCLEIVNNKDNNIITLVNNQPYILLKDYDFSRTINLRDIINYDVYIDTKQHINWYDMWTKKLDYYEYQMEQYENKYPLLYESFFYYDGLTELAISLLNNINYNKVKNYINHQRLTNRSTLRDLYNPLNMVIDTRIRDVAEYFKYCFFYNELSFAEVDNYINHNYLSDQESLLFLIRMIYPSYYFDLYDEIIIGNEKEEKIKKIINKNKKYELLLKHIYQIINNNYIMPQIEWLKK